MIHSISPEQLCMGCMASVEDKSSPCPHCGWQEEKETLGYHHLPPQTILNGKYLIGRVLGEGGFGITYLGWDLNLDMKVAIKEYYPAGYVTRENTVTTTVTPFLGDKKEAYLQGLEKYVVEAKRLAKFHDLPGIVTVKDFFKENGTAYIVMEYVDGVDLKQHLKNRGGKMEVNEVFDLVKPLMRSLSLIHAEGLIHRDISPDNIMLTRSGSLKLLDFGAARDISADGAKSLSVLLKPGYAPEEQYRTRGSQGPWTDVYALCATLYKMITGSTPPESMERLHQDELIPLSHFGLAITDCQETALMKGLAVFQAERYQNMGELIEALEASKPVHIQPQYKTDLSRTSPVSNKERVIKDETKAGVPARIDRLNKTTLYVGLAGASLQAASQLLLKNVEFYQLSAGMDFIGGLLVLVLIIGCIRQIPRWNAAKALMTAAIPAWIIPCMFLAIPFSEPYQTWLISNVDLSFLNGFYYLNLILFSLGLIIAKNLPRAAKGASVLVVVYGIIYQSIFTLTLQSTDGLTRFWNSFGFILLAGVILIMLASKGDLERKSC